MKKLMMALAVVAIAASVQAMSVDWKVSGSSEMVGYTAYLMAGDAASSFNKLSEITGAKLASGEIESRGRSIYAAADTSTSTSLSKTSNFYFVLVSSDETEYAISSTFAGASYVFNESATPPESAPGTATWAASSATFKEFEEEPEPTPEPTSGLLMLLGMAGLALRRKQK